MKTPKQFSADPPKDRYNQSEHGLSLVRAAEFDFVKALVEVDKRKNYGELREVALGFIGDRLHVLVFTMRGEVCRVISLRKANRREVKRYVENR